MDTNRHKSKRYGDAALDVTSRIARTSREFVSIRVYSWFDCL